jgi:hypothetical protein
MIETICVEWHMMIVVHGMIWLTMYRTGTERLEDRRG